MEIQVRTVYLKMTDNTWQELAVSLSKSTFQLSLDTIRWYTLDGTISVLDIYCGKL